MIEHPFIIDLLNVLTASGSCETIDQSATRLIDDIMTSTNEIVFSETDFREVVEYSCDS